MEEKKERAIIFSGGGSRFAIYSGIYAALEELGHKPDLIIGSCGGGMATNIISSFKTNIERKEYLKSLEFYNFIKKFSLTKERKLYKIGLDFKIRGIRNKKNNYIEDIFNKYLLYIPENVEDFLPTLAKSQGPYISNIIIGSKILFNKFEVGEKVNGRKLYKEIYMTDIKTKKLIEENWLSQKSKIFLNSSLSEKIEIRTDIPLLKASRISVSDIFYTNPVFYNGENFSGGFVDLIPIELAKSLSKEVILELKQKYKKIEEIALISTVGYSGNERMREVHDFNADYWIDTSDTAKNLKGSYISTKINLFKFQVELSIPETYEKYKNDIDIQWDYGYQRGKEAILSGKNNKKKMRDANFLNTSEEFRNKRNLSGGKN